VGNQGNIIPLKTRLQREEEKLPVELNQVVDLD